MAFAPRRPIAQAPVLVLIAALVATAAAAARGAGPADPLLKLVPPDAGAVLVVEDLAAHVRTVPASPLVEGLMRLPVVKQWQTSGEVDKLREALGRIETALQVDGAQLRDGLLGGPIVLALHLPPETPSDAARGLLLARVPDPALLARLIAGVNAAQTNEGELLRVSTRTRNGPTYHAREFAPGTRPDEYYLTRDDGLFAWSNSEELLQGVIDRQAGDAACLADLPAFRGVRGRLPEKAAASLFVDARFFERLLAASPRNVGPSDERVVRLLSDYLAAVQYVGVSLVWRDGPVFHTEELIDPSKLDGGLRRWAARTGPTDPRLLRVPANTLAAATAWVDLNAVLDGLRALTPEAQRPRFDNLVVAVRGMLLGRDLRGEVLPALGPVVTAHVDRPGGARLPLVVTVPTSGPNGPEIAAAVDNALRTFLALSSLDANKMPAAAPLESRRVGAGTITALAGGTTPFAFAVDEGRVVIGPSVEAVERTLAAQADPQTGARFRQVRDRYCPDARNFACVDLRALHEYADGHRPAIGRRVAERQQSPPDQAARDLDQALAFIRLFDAAYFSTSADPGLTHVHRILGLTERQPAAP